MHPMAHKSEALDDPLDVNISVKENLVLGTLKNTFIDPISFVIAPVLVFMLLANKNYHIRFSYLVIVTGHFLFKNELN